MRKKIFKILDEKFIEGLFKERFRNYFPYMGKRDIEKIEIKRISPEWAKESCLVKYQVFLKEGEEKTLRGTAKIGSPRKNTWEVMNYLWNHGFDYSSSLSVPKPLEFLEEFNFLLYEEVPGTIFSEILTGESFDKKEEKIMDAAQWLAKMHNLEVSSQKFGTALLLKPDDWLQKMKSLKKLMRGLPTTSLNKAEIDDLYQPVSGKKVLIHNDFYPDNLVTNGHFSAIDFDRSGLGDCLIDVAYLYGSLELPKEVRYFGLSPAASKDLQDIFLNSYCHLRKLDIKKTVTDLKKIFLPRVFLNQIRYYAGLTIKGWKFFDGPRKKGLEITLKTLISKLNEHST